MRVDQPDQMSKAFVEAYNAGDLHALLALYEPNATYVHGERTLTGVEAIREVFKKLTAARPKMEITNVYCVAWDDTALVRARWEIQWRDANNQMRSREGHSSEVLHRGIDGAWRYVIDHPTGGE